MLRDTLFHSPWTILIGCGVWIPLAFWIVGLTHWMIQGDVEFWWGVAGIAIGVGLGVVTMFPSHPMMGYFTFSAVVVTVLFVQPLRSALNRRALDAVDIDAAEDAYHMLIHRPDNRIARFKLAKLLYQRGMRASAIAFAQQALAGVTGGAYEEEARTLATWLRFAQRGRDLETSLLCLDCGAENSVNELHCRNCGASYLIDHLRGRWIGRRLARRLISGWIAVMLLVVGVPFALLSLPKAAAAALICGIVVLVSVALILGLRGGKDR